MTQRGKSTFSIAICDDDKRYVKYLRDVIKTEEQEEGDFGVFFFYTGHDLLEKNVSEYHLLILDMVLPNEDGRQIAREYRKRNKDGMIVFCTDKRNPIPEDFHINPYRFIRKEQTRQLQKDFRDILNEMYRREAKEKICLMGNRKKIILPIENIIYVDIIKGGSQIHYLDEKGEIEEIQVKEKLKEIYSQVFPFGFAYAHNSYIINCHKITQWGTKEVRVVGGTCLAISRSKEEAFHAACMKYIQ